MPRRDLWPRNRTVQDHLLTVSQSRPLGTKARACHLRGRGHQYLGPRPSSRCLGHDHTVYKAQSLCRAASGVCKILLVRVSRARPHSLSVGLLVGAPVLTKSTAPRTVSTKNFSCAQKWHRSCTQKAPFRRLHRSLFLWKAPWRLVGRT